MANEMEIAEENKPSLKQKSLLAKYEIPIDHLSYEYIRGCNNIKELEKIVKILRSGEEGYFPDLQKVAEERLRDLSPNNRHLRTEVPALNKSCFNRKEWGNIWDDIENWKKEVSNRERQLNKDIDCDAVAINLPPVRQPLPTKESSKSTKNEYKSKLEIKDYAFWDKYDVDTELVKMDLEEERKNMTEGNKTITDQTRQDRLELVATEAQKFSETEKQILAEKEKTRGNEYYRTRDYVEAEKCYTASLAIYPTANAFNNRAECFLKQAKYSAAVRDAENALKLDPNNIKALFRKGIALKHKDEFKKALESMNAILKQDPDHLQAQNVAKLLKRKIDSLKETKVSQCDLEIAELTTDRFSPESKQCFEVNEWGLPKVLCKCNGSLKCKESQPTLLSLRCPAVEAKPRNIRIIELSDEHEQPKVKKSTKLEIIEIEKHPHEPIEGFCMPERCSVVDKRTHKQGSDYGGGDVL